jgi:hypothetical protein
MRTDNVSDITFSAPETSPRGQPCSRHLRGRYARSELTFWTCLVSLLQICRLRSLQIWTETLKCTAYYVSISYLDVPIHKRRRTVDPTLSHDCKCELLLWRIYINFKCFNTLCSGIQHLQMVAYVICYSEGMTYTSSVWVYSGLGNICI